MFIGHHRRCLYICGCQLNVTARGLLVNSCRGYRYHCDRQSLSVDKLITYKLRLLIINVVLDIGPRRGTSITCLRCSETDVWDRQREETLSLHDQELISVNCAFSVTPQSELVIRCPLISESSQTYRHTTVFAGSWRRIYYFQFLCRSTCKFSVVSFAQLWTIVNISAEQQIIVMIMTLMCDDVPFHLNIITSLSYINSFYFAQNSAKTANETC